MVCRSLGLACCLAFWAIAGLGSLAVSIRRHGWNGETLSLVPLLAMTGAAILWLPKLFPDGLPIRGYGLMVLLGVVSGVAMATYRARQVGLNHELIWSLAFWLFVGGILGARLFYVIEYWNQRFRSDSISTTIFRVLDFPEGGLVIYGALLGGAIATIAFVRKHNLPLLAIADLITPSMLVGLALGRIGCLLNGCCYGGPSTLPWAVTFPPTSPPYLDQVANGEMYGFRLDVDHPKRPTIEYVESGSAAATAGLAAGDVITRINEYPIASISDAEQVLSQEFSTHEPLELHLAAGEKQVKLPAAVPPARSLPVHPRNSTRDRCGAASVVPVGVLPAAPARWRGDRSAAHDPPDQPLPAGDHPDGRAGRVGHGPEHFAEHKHHHLRSGRWALVLPSKPAAPTGVARPSVVVTWNFP